MDWRKFRKIELHRHLEGTVRLQTVLDVADEAGVSLPTRNLEELKRHALVLEPMENLAAVLDKFWLVQSVLATPSIIERISYENCKDAFEEGIRVLELRYSPSFINAHHPTLNYDIIHEAIVKGVNRAEKELNGRLAVGLIAIISRDQPMEEADKTTDFAINHRKTFVGFDLAGDEAGFPCRLFEKFFKKVRQAGLKITVHSGEADVPDSAKFVQESIEHLGAQRIGHGVQVAKDRKVADFVKKRDVVLELCPTSNVLTRAVPNIKSHPIKKLMEWGVPVTVNSDDPFLFGIDLTHEYEVLSQELDFSKKDFESLNERALKATFIDADKAARAWKG